MTKPPHQTRRSALKLGAAALAMPWVVRTAAAEDKTLNVYNWADYIGETTLKDFEAATGIKVTYDTFSSTDEMEAKMLAGHSGYDVVTQAGLNLERFNKAGTYDTLDRSKLPGWANLDPEVMRILAGWDPGNSHGIPLFWGTVGMTYNVDMVKDRLPNADLTSLDMIFKPEIAAKLSDCGISILDAPANVLQMALRYLGKDGDTTNLADYRAVVDLIKPVRKYIRTFDNTNFLNAIPNKELCVINNWSGDYATARKRASDAGVKINLAYFVPKTGAPVWMDCLCIPADAAHKDNAYKFLDFLLRPDVMAKCTNFTNYANGNTASKKFIDAEILANPAIYPDAATTKLLWAPKPFSAEQDRALNEAWRDIKNG